MLVFEQSLVIAAPPACIWQALIDPALVAQYHFVQLVLLELEPGGRIHYGVGEDVMISGNITSFLLESVLAHTFYFGLEGYRGTAEDPVTHVTYTLIPEEAGTRLTLRHEGFPTENQSYANISGGWPSILNALKTLIEPENPTKSTAPKESA